MSDSQSREEIPRVMVDTVDDWEHVKTNYTSAIHQVLEAKLSSTIHTQQDREALLAHLLQWRDRTFEIAKQNLRVNGRNFEDYAEEEEETEPFDEALDRRIWSLSEERIHWDKCLADRRRRTPADVQRLMEDLVKRQQAAEYIPTIEEEPNNVDMSEAIVVSPEQQERTTKTYETLLSSISELNEQIPKLVERADRARKVADEVANLSP
ncbi:hypothetical protein BOTBODRAFT_162571 [Botryobasidium botryosum FD-172 SS1]|uniref:Uncharacterized protein n=1 Tax=Botryobasidium botryosum (strain FD-172 SS1) TaxID=930990 RepID=A0A067MJJ8_BOTB1|nr:hypothetical protein BOTBODRAFT_162571 [Botryobasidium botryosum FD-172 SS1]